MNNLFVASENSIRFRPWHGELGWEVMTWIPFLRKRAADYSVIVASSYAEMRPLYQDFVTIYWPHEIPARGLDYPKMYRVDGKHLKYGKNGLVDFDVAIHARNIRRKANINYKKWLAVITGLRHLSVAWIGSKEDTYLPQHGIDCRGIAMDNLVDLLASSKIVVGVSSGVMHLAAACGANLVCWGDNRTYFGETLEKRYKETWNPHRVSVQWLTANDWQPEPIKILKRIEKGLET